MRIFVRASVAIGGLMLLVMSIGGYQLRKEPSTAYWVFGETDTATTRRYIISSPTGGVQKTLLDAPLVHRPQFVGWLPEGDKIIYEWRNEDNSYEIRLLELHNSRHPTFLTQHSFGLAESVRSLTTTHDQQWIIIPLRSQAGVSLFRLRHDGRVFEQISPVFDSIDYGRLALTSDDEWLYFQASDGGEIPTVMYRQHVDGTALSELLRAQQNISLYIAVDDTAFLTINAFGPQATTDLYRIATTDLEPQHIWTSDGPYFLMGQLQSNWIILGSIVTQPDYVGQILSRIHPNGEDFEVMVESLSGIGFSQEGDMFYFRAEGDNGPVAMGMNVNTLEQHPITASGMFDEIHWVGLSPNHTEITMEAVVDNETQIYAANLDGSNLRVTANLGRGESRYIFTPLISDWQLISTKGGTPNRPKTSYQRIHSKTGERQDLLTLDYASEDVVLTYTPVDDMIILTASRSSRNVENYWLRLSDGQSGRANFGVNLSFSKIIDTEWQMTIMVIVAFVLLLFSILPIRRT